MGKRTSESSLRRTQPDRVFPERLSGSRSRDYILPHERISEFLHELVHFRVKLETRDEDLRISRSAIESSREIFADYFDTITTGYAVLNRTGLFIAVNSAWEHEFGYHRDEMLGKTIEDIMVPGEARKFREHITIPTSGENAENIAQFKCLQKNGSRITVNTHFPTDGPAAYSIIIVTTGRLEELRKAIRYSEKHHASLQTILDAIPAPIYYKGIDGGYLGCNMAFARLMGRPRDEIIGKNAFDIAPGALANLYHEHDADLLRSGGVREFEAPLSSHDGSYRNVIFYKSVFHAADGKPAGIVGTILDISGKKTVEQALHQLETVVQTMIDGIITLDADGTVIYANQAAGKILGFTTEELYGITFTDSGWIGRDENKHGFPSEGIPFLTSLRDRTETREREYRITGRSGAIKWLSVNQAPLYKGDGTFHGAVASFRDITDKKDLEKRLDRLRNENDAFIRHEFKNLLVPMKGYSELLLLTDQSNLTERQRMYLDIIRMGADNAINIIDFIKKIQDIEFGIYPIEKTRLTLKEVVEGAITHTLQKAEKAGVKLDFHSTQADTSLDADAQLLPDIFEHLIQNAIEHVSGEPAENDRTVLIDLSVSGKDAVFRIINRGKPIPPEKLTTFFDKFNSDRKKKAGGTGLGTTYAYLVIKAHGGTITVESDSISGTTVSVRLALIS